jgi:hypothetical protein
LTIGCGVFPSGRLGITLNASTQVQLHLHYCCILIFSPLPVSHAIAATETHGGAGGDEEGDKNSISSEVKKQLRLACVELNPQSITIMYIALVS